MARSKNMKPKEKGEEIEDLEFRNETWKLERRNGKAKNGSADLNARDWGCEGGKGEEERKQREAVRYTFPLSSSYAILKGMKEMREKEQSRQKRKFSSFFTELNNENSNKIIINFREKKSEFYSILLIV